jgi:diaminopimelate epimerase
MRFSKWHALGNDYLLLERADLLSPLDPALVRRLCDYHHGVGGDGALEIVRADGRAAEIVIWNSDGSTAELSGNGTRIAARWLADRAGASEVRIVASGRTVLARMLDDLLVETELGEALVGSPETIDVDGERLEFTPVSVGNPHAVVLHDPTRGELLRLGPRIEVHPRFPDRTNVQLVRPDAPHELTVAVWERGVGETLSSGTSACAASAAAVANGWCESPVAVRLPGGELAVALDASFCATLTGPAQEICRGELTAAWLADRDES